MSNTQYALREEYDGRGTLTIWTGSFAEGYVGTARLSPVRKGYNVTLQPSHLSKPLRFFVAAPERGDRNFMEVDHILAEAIKAREVG